MEIHASQLGKRFRQYIFKLDIFNQFLDLQHQQLDVEFKHKLQLGFGDLMTGK